MSENRPNTRAAGASYEAPAVSKENLDSGGNYVSPALKQHKITPVEGTYTMGPLGDGSVIP